MTSFVVFENDASDSFNLESPKLAHTSIPSLTTSGRKLQRKKPVEMLLQTGLDRILVPQRFVSPPIGGLLVFILIIARVITVYVFGHGNSNTPVSCPLVGFLRLTS